MLFCIRPATPPSCPADEVPRHDFYQTDTVLTLSIYIKGLSPSDVSLSLAPTSVRLLLWLVWLFFSRFLPD